MKCTLSTVLTTIVFVAVALPSFSTAAEVPTVLSPAMHRSDAPAEAIPAHAKRVGSISFDFSALQPPPDAEMQAGYLPLGRIVR